MTDNHDTSCLHEVAEVDVIKVGIEVNGDQGWLEAESLHCNQVWRDCTLSAFRLFVLHSPLSDCACVSQ